MPEPSFEPSAKTRTVPYDVAEQLRTPARALGDIARAKGMNSGSL